MIGIVTRLRTGRSGVRFLTQAKYVSPLEMFAITHRLTEWVVRLLSSGWGVKKPGRETDHSPLSSSEVVNEWSYTTTPRCGFVGCGGTLLRYRLPLPSLVGG